MEVNGNFSQGNEENDQSGVNGEEHRRARRWGIISLGSKSSTGIGHTSVSNRHEIPCSEHKEQDIETKKKC